MRLSDLKLGERAEIIAIHVGVSSLRIMELGMVKGTQVRMTSLAPTGDPIAFQVNDSIVSLRKADAQLVEVRTIAIH